MGLDTSTYWLTDRQSQCDFDFDLIGWGIQKLIGGIHRQTDSMEIA
jgi:hypothetical protein